MNIMIYLDNAATTVKKPSRVYKAVLREALHGGNAGRSGSRMSMNAVRTIIETQEAAAELFGIENESNIVFTQNATYALNMGILGALKPEDHMLVTVMDHNSVLRPAVAHGRYSAAGADSIGYVSPASVRKRINDNTALVVCTHVSNVCGTAEPVEEIARTAHARGALFMLDCSQSAGSRTVNVNDIGADMIACAGHKGLMGPMGTGILYIKEPERIRAVITGGTGSESYDMHQPRSMPDKFHCGTLNTPAIAGLREGIRFVLKEGAENIGLHEKMLADEFRLNLMNMGGITVYGRGDSGITAFNIDGIESAETEQLLGKNFAVRAGYHCAPLAHRALGSSDGGSVRVSFGYFNSRRDMLKITDAVYSIKKAVSSTEHK